VLKNVVQFFKEKFTQSKLANG